MDVKLEGEPQEITTKGEEMPTLLKRRIKARDKETTQEPLIILGVKSFLV